MYPGCWTELGRPAWRAANGHDGPLRLPRRWVVANHPTPQMKGKRRPFCNGAKAIGEGSSRYRKGRPTRRGKGELHRLPSHGEGCSSSLLAGNIGRRRSLMMIKRTGRRSCIGLRARQPLLPPSPVAEAPSPARSAGRVESPTRPAHSPVGRREAAVPELEHDVQAGETNTEGAETLGQAKCP